MVALATIVAVVLAFGALASAPAGQAYAASGKAGLQAEQVKPSASPAITVTTKAVKKKYPSKQKMTMTMAGGDTTTIKTSRVGAKMKWSSSNKKAVRVKSTGKYTAKVTARKPGKAIITAKGGGQALTCKVTVTGALSKTSIEMTPFETSKLSLKGAKAKKWKTSDSSIVTVSKGKLTPQATGTATVTCVDKKGYKYKCAVTVKCPGITCQMTDSTSMNIGGSALHVKSFTLANKSGKNIVLGPDETIGYYPNGINSTSYELLGCNSAGQFFDAGAITVANQASYSFYGIGANDTALTQSGLFSLYFKADNVQYRALFRNTGEMTACVRV